MMIAPDHDPGRMRGGAEAIRMIAIEGNSRVRMLGLVGRPDTHFKV